MRRLIITLPVSKQDSFRAKPTQIGMAASYEAKMLPSVRARQAHPRPSLPRLHDRRVGGLLALENPTGGLTHFAVHIRDVVLVAH
jgi:hypothetical protein